MSDDLMFSMDEDLDQYTKTGLKYTKPKPPKKPPKFLKKGEGEKRRKNISKKNRKKREIHGFASDVGSMLKKASRKKYDNELSKKQHTAIEAIEKYNANLKLKPKSVNKFFQEYPIQTELFPNIQPMHTVSSNSSSSDDEIMIALQKHLNEHRIKERRHKARFNKMKGGKKRRRKKTRKRKKKKKKKSRRRKRR